MEALRFDNRFISELPGDPDQSPRRRQVVGAVWSNTAPTPVPAPRLIAHSREVAELLEIPDAFIACGLRRVSAATPLAACSRSSNRVGATIRQLGRPARRRPRDPLGEVVTRKADAGSSAQGLRPHAVLTHRRRRGLALVGPRILVQRMRSSPRLADDARARLVATVERSYATALHGTPVERALSVRAAPSFTRLATSSCPRRRLCRAAREPARSRSRGIPSRARHRGQARQRAVL